jgi:hypothetical protein
LPAGAGTLVASAVAYTGLNFRLAREGHITERYTKAIEQLGSVHLDVRLGAIYALERIMIDSVSDHPMIVGVLAAFIREYGPAAAPLVGQTADGEQTEPPPAVIPDRLRTTDVNAALAVLGRRPRARNERGASISEEWICLERVSTTLTLLSLICVARASLVGSYSRLT